MSQSAQYRPFWRQFSQVRRPNQQRQSTEGKYLQGTTQSNSYQSVKNIEDIINKSKIDMLRATTQAS